MRAHDDHGDFVLARDLAEHFETVHARHFEIERDDTGAQLFDFFQPDFAVHRGAYNFDGRVVRKRLRNQLAHQRRVIDHEHSDFFAHAMAPRGAAFDSCATTAGTFRISTTVPSPRIDAPLTSGEVTRLSSSALMTSSSSPNKLSTARPNFRLPAEIMTTNVRSGRWFTMRGPSPSRRINGRTWSRSWKTSRSSTRCTRTSTIRVISTTDASGT